MADAHLFLGGVVRKHGNGGRSAHRGTKPTQSVVVNLQGDRVERLHQANPMGASWRQYPRSEARKALIERLRGKPEAQRSGDDWWQLGEYQVVDGLSTGDDSMVNAGSQALMSGASMNPPHAGCLLDLGWLLCYKGLDQMALFYLEKAAGAVPTSRDVWTLQGWACIGTGAREQAIAAFRKAVSLPGATKGDRTTLESLEAGESLESLRKNLVLRKFDDEVVRSKRGDPKEAARSGVVQLKQMLERKPDDVDLAYGLAYCYYILGQFDHAEPLLLRVIGGQPEHADALTILGLISMKRGQPEQQLSYYERAVSADPRHVLANTNLASMYQDRGDFHRARPLLVRAIEAASEDDPHLPIALDLLGNSYGTIEHDYAREAELHRRAIALGPGRPLFHANLIVSLLSADRGKDAQRALQAARDARMNLPNQSLLEGLVRLYQERTLHPYQYMQSIDQLAQGMGWPALKPLVRRAWDRRNVVGSDEQIDFLGSLGMMASRTGDKELALEIWRHGMTLPGGEPFGTNVAAELSVMQRHPEALAAAEVMSMATARSWTILGNVRLNAGLYKLAMEAYRTALDRDERFLLPISNAISTAQEGYLAEELDPFIERLSTDWQSSPAAISLLGQAFALQGRLSSAADCFERALWNGDRVRTPEEIWSGNREKDDLSLLGQPDLEHHYMAAKCLLELGRLDRVLALGEQVRRWPKWMNGDWMILEAEVYLSGGNLDRASAVIAEMTDQPPSRVVAAKVAVVRGEFEEADRLILLGLSDEHADRFNHPAGRPDALFRVFAAERALANCNSEQSENLARDAVRRDPSCAAARVALANALAGRASEAERQELLADGLRRAPGHPDLVVSLVESLVGEGKVEEASAVLDKQKPLLIERNGQIVAHRLGEFLAVDKLSRLQGNPVDETMSKSAWPWLEMLQPPIRDWLRGARLALVRGDDLAAAYGLYVSKAAEYLLMEKVMHPFRNSMSDACTVSSDRHRDAARFMAGGAPPSIGGIARLFQAAGRSHRSSEDELTTRFRNAISQGMFGDPRTLRSSEFVDQLLDLGKARNSAAHLGDHDLSELRLATRCVVADDQPGILFAGLRVFGAK